jgi:hypothetical protein
LGSARLGLSQKGGLGRLQVDDELEFGRLQHWEVGELRALEDLTAHNAGLTKPTP